MKRQPKRTPVFATLSAIPILGDPRAIAAVDIDGVDPFGHAVRIPLSGREVDTLLVFLSTDCAGCRSMWTAASDGSMDLGAGGIEIVVVTRGFDSEDQKAVQAWSSLHRVVPVVASDAAYRAYGVFGGPFYSLVPRAGGTLLCEGVVIGPEQVALEVRRARRYVIHPHDRIAPSSESPTLEDECKGANGGDSERDD